MNSKEDVLHFLMDYMAERTSQTVIRAWFSDAEILELTEHKVVIQTSAEFKRDILQKRYEVPVREALSELFGYTMDVEFVVEGYTAPDEPNGAPSFCQSAYTFDRFVVGESNKFAAYAAQAVADSPGTRYNPLFIYGESGLGKTHMMYSIFNHVRQTKPHYIIRDVTGETFTNELAMAIRHGTTAEFRKKYREVDMILVDDIQFIGGKDYSQEEFFHTFNALYQVANQIVVTSDRPPKDMPLLEERLKTRFDAGLLVDVKPPDFETRMAIIKATAARLGLIPSDDVVLFIAQSVTNNIRQLEGSVKKLTAYRDMFGNITLDGAQRAIGDLMQEHPGINPTPAYIMEEVCRYFRVDERAVLSNRRHSSLVAARQAAMYIIRMMTDMSLIKVGEFFQRDHTTVLYNVDKIEQQRLTDPALDTQIKTIMENIKNR